MSAQATRNRELEQQLHVFRGGSSNEVDINGSSEDDALVLHEEIDGFNLDGLNSSETSSSLPRTATRRRASASVSRKKFGGSELESVAEMEQDTDHQQEDQDQDMERPSTAGTSGSPSGSGSDDVEAEEEEERGRKGRDGRPMGFGGHVKTEDAMET